MAGGGLGNCRLLTSCYVHNHCLTEAADEVCEVVRAVQKTTAWQRTGSDVKQGKKMPSTPMMWPPPSKMRARPVDICTTLNVHAVDGSVATGDDTAWQPSSSSRSTGDKAAADLDRGVHEQAHLADAVSRGGVSYMANPGPWRRACEQQRAQAIAGKALVRQVADWGPEAGTLVDIHTGVHRPVTYWLRDDVRAFCVFDRDDTQVRVYSCSQMERVDGLEKATEVVARQFFLGLREEDMRKGILITMERSAHGRHVVQQGHVGMLRAQLMLLSKSSMHQQDLLGAIRAINAEFLVHDRPPHSGDAFCQLSDDRDFEKSISGVFAGGEDWPPAACPVPISELSTTLDPPSPDSAGTNDNGYCS